MSSRVRIKEDQGDTLISIRSSGGSRFVGLVALCGMLLPVFTGEMTLARALSYGAVPILLVALYTTWLFFGAQEIRISDKEIRMQYMVGPLKLAHETSIETVAVRSVEMKELSYIGKGGNYVNRALEFLSETGVFARSWQLSREDSEALLEGPLRRFAKAS